MNRSKTIVAVLAVLFGSAIGIALLCGNFNRWPFDLKKLDGLTDASTQQEVTAMLGQPSSTWTRTNKNGEAYQEWAYSRPLAWPIVYIYFDPDGTYSTNECDY